MKRAVCLVLLLALLAIPALAEPIIFGEALSAGDLNVTLTGTSVEDEWHGASSDTHAWIVVSLTAQSFATEPVNLHDALSGTLTFLDKYAYDAELEFDSFDLEPLVLLTGRLVFRVPLMVARADASELKLMVTWAGIPHPAELKFTHTAPDGGSAYFGEQEDAVLHFLNCLKDQDFEGALRAAASDSVAEGYDYEAMINRIQCVSPLMAMPLPSDYAPYAALNAEAFKAQTRRQMVSLVQSLLVAPDFVDGLTHPLMDGEVEIESGHKATLGELKKHLDPARLSGLEIRGVYRVDSEVFCSEANRANIKKQGAIPASWWRSLTGAGRSMASAPRSWGLT
jgi:hypothetical protein